MEITIVLDEYNTEQFQKLTSLLEHSDLDESAMVNEIMTKGMHVVLDQLKGVLSDFSEGKVKGTFSAEDD